MSYIYLKQLCIQPFWGGVFYKCQVKLVDRVKSSIACFSCYFFIFSPPLLPEIPFLSVILVCVFAFGVSSNFDCYVFKFTHFLFCNVLFIPASIFHHRCCIFHHNEITFGSFLYLPFLYLAYLIFPLLFRTYEVYLCFNIHLL